MADLDRKPSNTEQVLPTPYEVLKANTPKPRLSWYYVRLLIRKWTGIARRQG